MNARGRGDSTALTAVACGALLGTWALGSPPLPLFLDYTPGTGSAQLTAPAAEGPPHTATLPADASWVPSQEGVAFHASSLGSGFAIQGDYGGRVVRPGDELRVLLPQALLRSLGPARPGERIANIHLALAEETASGWRIVRSGPELALGEPVVTGGDVWLTQVTLSLPEVSEQEMVGRWLVVATELVSWENERAQRTWTYAHADVETLPRLMGWFEDGC